jgi:hypothetical protein
MELATEPWERLLSYLTVPIGNSQHYHYWNLGLDNLVKAVLCKHKSGTGSISGLCPLEASSSSILLVVTRNISRNPVACTIRTLKQAQNLEAEQVRSDLVWIMHMMHMLVTQGHQGTDLKQVRKQDTHDTKTTQQLLLLIYKCVNCFFTNDTSSSLCFSHLF